MAAMGMRHAVGALVIGGLVLGSLAAGGLVLGRVGLVDDEYAAKQADRAFVAGLARGDSKAIRGMLDRHFTWIDAEGRAHGRRDMLKQLPTFAGLNLGDREVQTHFYGRMLTVRSAHDNAHFLRVLVRRNHGWKAVALMETAITPEALPAPSQPSSAGTDCTNPCRSVPYVPKTQTDKDVLATWQRSKMLEWKGDAALWGTFHADEFQRIDNAAVRGKEERYTAARRAQEAGLGSPGDPVTSMRIFDFGTKCALMVAQQAPYRGGKPYASMRVWVNRDNRWQLALSQQSAIKSAPAIASTQ